MDKLKQPISREKEEETILGSIILRPQKLFDVIEFLKPDNFYSPKNRIIYETILEMFNNNIKIDIISVTNEVRKKGKLEEIGGAFYITELTGNVVSSENVDYYSLILLESYMSRKLMEISYTTYEEAQDETKDIFETISDAQSKIELLMTEVKSGKKDITKLCSEILEKIEVNQNNFESVEITTGDSVYDKFSYGLHKTDLVILAGEGSNGKTSKALDICLAVARSGKPIAFYSLEMTPIRITARLVAKITGIDSKRILNDKLEDWEIKSVHSAITELNKLPVHFDECPSANYKDIINSIRADRIKYGIEVAVVDYLQLLTSAVRNKTREQEVGDFVKAFKRCAKQIDICIIALSQLSRDREKPKPSLSRLRDSGQIEEAADVVILMWIPQRYGKDTITFFNGKEIVSKNRVHIIIAKGRDIGTTDYAMDMEFKTQTFTNIDEEDFPEKPKVERTDWLDLHEKKDG